MLSRHANMKRALGLAPHLIAAGHKVTICMEDAVENRAVVAEISGCDAIFYPRSSWWRERNQKRRLLSSAGFDLVHICGLGWRNALLPGIELNVPAVIEHTELESAFLDTSIARRTAQWLLEFGSTIFYKNIVVSSKYLEQLFHRRLQFMGLRHRILYLPFASHESIADSAGSRAPAIAAEFGSARVILYMGSIVRAYGVFDLLDALVEMHKTRTDWVCVYVGGGEDRPELEKQAVAKGLGHLIRFLGHVPEEDMAAWMRRAAVFISPLNDTVRDWARCPSKIFIYMMFGKPIVTCRIGENLNALGEDGFYYDPGDRGSMCRAINHALDSSAGWCPGYKKETHTWKARASEYERWLQSIPASGNAGIPHLRSCDDRQRQ
jgi:glycosyltransferase involved in cell wall biosynthesis